MLTSVYGEANCRRHQATVDPLPNGYVLQVTLLQGAVQQPVNAGVEGAGGRGKGD